VQIDNHCHLQNFPSEEACRQALQRARKKGVGYFFCNATGEADWEPVARMAREEPDVTPLFGLHPGRLLSQSSGWEKRLEGFLDLCPSAVGEIGLDLCPGQVAENLQVQAFRVQWHLAAQRGRVVSLHLLRGWKWLEKVLQEDLSVPGFLLHAYSGSAEQIPGLLKWGGYFSFTSAALQPKRVKAREALLKMPLDRLLLESDAPSGMAEPGGLSDFYEAVAALRGIAVAEFEAILEENARRFWGELLFVEQKI